MDDKMELPIELIGKSPLQENKFWFNLSEYLASRIRTIADWPLDGPKSRDTEKTRQDVTRKGGRDQRAVLI